MPAKKSSKKSKSIKLVPDWAVAGLVLLNEKRTPTEKDYTHRSAQQYADPEFDGARRLDVVRANVERGSNLGLVPPYGVVIIDCDNAQAVDLVAPIAPPNTPHQWRKEDKQHFYFRIDPSRYPLYTRSLNLDGAKIDTRTWGYTDPEMKGGGYAVIPPSVSEKDGIAYTWACPLPDEIEDIPMIPEELAELLLPHFTRKKSGARAPRSGDEVPRHDQILSYTARCVRYESRTDPEAGIARVIAKGRALVEKLYAGEPGRMQEEIDSLDRNVRSAWAQWGGTGALDESTKDHWFGKMISESYGDPWLFPHESKTVFEWDGVRWKQAPLSLLSSSVEAHVEILHADAMAEPDPERRKKIRAMADSLADSKKNGSVSSSIRRMYDCSIELFDSNPDLITFPNGVTLNTHTGETRDVDPEDHITRVAGAAYVQGARHPVVDHWWETSFPDPDTRRAVEEIFGLSLAGRVYEERIYSLYGTQGSGKGTLLFSWLAVLGEYGVLGHSASLSGDGGIDGSRKDFSLVNYRGCRGAGYDEFEGTLGEKAKALTQAGQITASEKYGSDYTFPIQFTSVLTTNRRPKVRDPQGWNRRAIEIPMNAGARDIYNLDSSIKHTLLNDPDALSAMLWRFIEGLNRARENGHRVVFSKEILEATNEWLQEANKIGDWLTHGVEVTNNPDDQIPNAFTEYTSWMNDQHLDRRDYPRASKMEFASLMKSRGFEAKRTTKGMAYTGLKLKESEPAARGKVVRLPGFKGKSDC